MHIAALSPARTLALGAVVAVAAAPSAGLPAAAARADVTTQSGTLVQVVSDDFANGRAGHAYGLQRADRSFVTVEGLAPREARSLVGDQVRVTGRSVGKGRVVAESVVAVAAADAGTTTSSTSAATTGADTGTGMAASYRKVAVVLVNFADSPTQPVTPDQVRSTMFEGPQSVDAYYQDVSDGRLGVTGDVLGWYTVQRSSTSTCDYAAWGNAARGAAVGAGVDLSGYQSVMYYWPKQSACSWAGLGQVPGSTTWINGYNTLRVLAHELGHNLGEHHAQSQQCTANGSPVAFPGAGTSCSVVEYGDPFTVMGGSSWYLQSNAARSHYGYVSPVTSTSGVGGSYTLVPADSTSGGTRLVRVPRGDGSYLSLEFRQPTGAFDTFASTAPVANGVTIRIDWGTGTKQTTLVDTVPSTTSYTDAPLLSGRSVTDPVSGATISVTGVSASGAQVSVSYGGSGGPTPPPADTTAPTAVSGLTATPASTSSGSTVSLTWQAATDDTCVAGYRVTRGSSTPVTVAGTSWTDTAVSAGATYTYSVAAVDAAGNVGPSRSVTVSVPTAQPPTDTKAPTGVTRLKAAVKQGEVTLTWAASSDDVGVLDYEVTRSTVVARTTATRWTDRPGAGTWTYTVVARDAAGNRSAAASVKVTLR